MLQNTSYMFFLKRNKTKQNDYKKKREKSHKARVKPETSDVWGKRAIHCTKQPLQRLHVK